MPIHTGAVVTIPVIPATIESLAIESLLVESLAIEPPTVSSVPVVAAPVETVSITAGAITVVSVETITVVAGAITVVSVEAIAVVAGAVVTVAVETIPVEATPVTVISDNIAAPGVSAIQSLFAGTIRDDAIRRLSGLPRINVVSERSPGDDTLCNHCASRYDGSQQQGRLTFSRLLSHRNSLSMAIDQQHP